MNKDNTGYFGNGLRAMGQLRVFSALCALLFTVSLGAPFLFADHFKAGRSDENLDFVMKTKKSKKCKACDKQVSICRKNNRANCKKKHNNKGLSRYRYNSCVTAGDRNCVLNQKNCKKNHCKK